MNLPYFTRLHTSWRTTILAGALLLPSMPPALSAASQSHGVFREHAEAGIAAAVIPALRQATSGQLFQRKKNVAEGNPAPRVRLERAFGSDSGSETYDPFVTLPNGRLLISCKLRMDGTADECLKAALKKAAGDPRAALESPVNLRASCASLRGDLLEATFSTDTNTVQRLINQWSREYKTTEDPFKKREIEERERRNFEALIENARRHLKVATVMGVRWSYDVEKEGFVGNGWVNEDYKDGDCLPNLNAVFEKTVAEMPAAKARPMFKRVEPTKGRAGYNNNPAYYNLVAYIEGTLVEVRNHRFVQRLEKVEIYCVEVGETRIRVEKLKTIEGAGLL